MRNKETTIQSLRALAERPGTVEEGRTARRMLEKLGVSAEPKPFVHTDFPRGTTVYYNKGAYAWNEAAVIACDAPQIHEGKTWMRLRFLSLKTPRWVPVTSPLGCHISKFPVSWAESKRLGSIP